MNDLISGVVKLLIGGFVIAVLGRIAWQSLWNREVRAEFFSLPNLRNPSLGHKIVYSIMTAAALYIAAMLVLSGFSHLAALVS